MNSIQWHNGSLTTCYLNRLGVGNAFIGGKKQQVNIYATYRTEARKAKVDTFSLVKLLKDQVIFFNKTNQRMSETH